MKHDTALVTGATGFIGSHLVELLLREHHTVRVLLRRTSSTKWLDGLPVEFVYGDLFDEQALRQAVEGVDYVYHSAGLTKAKTKEEYFRGNTQGTQNLLDAAIRWNPAITRFVQISSQTAAGPSPTREPITEDHPPEPITTYGRSKLAAEESCLRVADRIPVTIVRPPVVYGPRDRDVFEFFNTFRKGLQPMVGFSEKYVSMIHVHDLVRGFLMAARSDRARGQIYFLSTPGVFGWKEIGDTTRRVMGKKALRVRIPESGVYVISAFAELFSLFSTKPALINFEKARDMVQDYWTCDASKAKRQLGFESEIGLEQGIRDTVEWYAREGWL